MLKPIGRKKLLILLILYGLVNSACENPKKNEASNIRILNDTAIVKNNKNSLNFIVVGDWGVEGANTQKKVAQQMNQYASDYNVQFVISTGDNFYPRGIKNTEDPQWRSSFENVYQGASLQKDWYVVLGNHDYLGNPEAEIAYTKKSNRWKLPAHYYSISKKNGPSDSALFVFIDTSPFVQIYRNDPAQYPQINAQDQKAQLLWLDNLLTHSKSTWKIVIGHHPIFSAGMTHGDTPELIANLKPVLEKNKVQAYFSGHEHDLQHLKSPSASLDYYISGAGSETRPAGTNDITKFSKASPGFAFVSLTHDSLRVFFINEKGEIVYHTAKGK
jgi:tartrate-resistant acid phosphatase type 5